MKQVENNEILMRNRATQIYGSNLWVESMGRLVELTRT